MEVIGMTGAMAAGKDEFYKQLDEDGMSVRRLSFADALRQEIENTVGSGMYLPALWKKPLIPEARALLQWWGTEYRRKDDPEYWLKIVHAQIQVISDDDDRLETNTLIVVTDVRFPNEAKVITSYGGLIVSVFTPQVIRSKRLGLSIEELARVEGHASEHAMSRVQTDVTVDGSQLPYRYLNGHDKLKAYLMNVDRDLRRYRGRTHV